MSQIAYITADAVQDLAVPQATLLDGMIDAQDQLAQVTWTALSHAVAFGTYNDGDVTDARVAVFDLDLADGMDVIRVTNWALGHSDELPELRS